MENPSSPLDTLRQLKEMLDAGALTPTEFEALKQRLVFAPAAPGTASAEAVAVPDTPAAPAPPVDLAVTGPEVWAANASAVPLPVQPAFPVPNPPEPPPAAPVVQVEALVFEAVPQPSFMPEASADFPIAVGGPGYIREEAQPEANSPDLPGAPAERSSALGLVLAIGAVLVFLAVVAYLGFTRPTTDEHISSISQTAADSLNTAIETGPQVAPLPAATAAPETVRVAPTNPASALPSRAELERKAAAVRDSVAPDATPATTDSTVRQ